MTPRANNGRQGPKPFRVLALDGGGMRGLYSATVLDAFTRHFANERGVSSLDVGKGFDLIVGTSTGGLVACGLAVGMVPKELVELFRRVGPMIFKRPLPPTKFGFLRWVFRSLGRPANSDDALRTALTEKFGQTTLGEAFNTRRIALCIPAVNIRTGRSLVFKTPHLPGLTRDHRFRLVDVCLATSAAPIYLPLAAIDDPDDAEHQLILADGGLWANNPVLIGLIEALALAGKRQPIQILSVSTCPSAQGAVASSANRHWGIFKWRAGTAALTMALESQAWGYHYMAFRLAEVLREHGRDCTVIRVPHTAPSVEQAIHVALDGASERSLQVLAELGRLDGDMDAARSNWISPSTSEILSDMFNKMPVTTSDAKRERRLHERHEHEIDLGGGLRLKDRSATGACMVIQGSAPALGATFRCAAAGIGELHGTVRWVHQMNDGATVFGLQTEPSEQPAGV